MKITKLTRSSFRGIASEFLLALDAAGKNLLIYRENRAAKSSLKRGRATTGYCRPTAR